MPLGCNKPDRLHTAKDIVGHVGAPQGVYSVIIITKVISYYCIVAIVLLHNSNNIIVVVAVLVYSLCTTTLIGSNAWNAPHLHTISYRA